MSLKYITATCSHINLYMILSLFSIIIRLVESKVNLSIHPFVKTNDPKSVETFAFVGNGRLDNMTIHQKGLKEPSNKLPPAMAQAMQRQFQSSSPTSVFPNQRMGLDIKEVVLTNLDDNDPKPIVIQNHEEYSRENDRFEFSSRYLMDYTSAIGKDILKTFLIL